MAESVSTLYRKLFCEDCKQTPCTACKKFMAIMERQDRAHTINELRGTYGYSLDYFLELEKRFEGFGEVLEKDFCLFVYNVPDGKITMILLPNGTIISRKNKTRLAE